MFPLKLINTFPSKLKLTIQNIRSFHLSQSQNRRHDIYLQYSPNAILNKDIVYRFWRLPLPECRLQITYVWIDGTGENLRSKDRVFTFLARRLKDFSVTEVDGSQSYQASADETDIVLKPVRLYLDPFRIGKFNRLVMTEAFKPNGEPCETNFRQCFNEAMLCVEEHKVLFGLEQKYTLLDMNLRPLGWPYAVGYPVGEGPYYCGLGGDKIVGREVLECFYKAGLYAGLDIGGGNQEKHPSQWEFQIGPSKELKGADDIWISRYIIQRIGEEYGVIISFDPKPVEGDDWTGQALHTNFSTRCMRLDNGYSEIEKAIDKLEKNHLRHIQVYDPHGSKDNERRVKCKLYEFTRGVGDRTVAVRIPKRVEIAKKGWLEDRRPAANADPYQVCNAIVRTVLLDE